MAMRVHELHPALIHAPLVLLPAAAAVDLLASRRSWPRRLPFDLVGRRMWWGTAATGLLAGLAGMAASQEVHVDDERAHDAMWVHGLGNLTLVLAAAGVATWRTTHRASLGTGMLGLGALAASLYTAWLGGELVYAHGVGVQLAGGAHDVPALLSAEGPGRLARDAVAGLGWLLRRAGRILTGREELRLRAVAPGSEELSEPGAPPHLH